MDNKPVSPVTPQVTGIKNGMDEAPKQSKYALTDLYRIRERETSGM